jgi:DNA-binding response OmpR family regulator
VNEAAGTILFVDDDPYVRKVLCVHLSRSGFEVLSAADGVDALEAAGRYKGKIHLLVSDVMMPRMSGPELAQALQLCRPDVKVLLISASTDLPLDPGTEWEFLRKPFAPAVLLEKVRAMLPDPAAKPAGKPDELLRDRMRDARAQYVRYSQEYDLLLALTGDPSAADADRMRAIRKAAELRKSMLHAYAESVRQFSEFIRIKQMPDTRTSNAAG